MHDIPDVHLPSIEPRQSRRGVSYCRRRILCLPRPSIEPRQSRRGVASASNSMLRTMKVTFNRAAAVTPRSPGAVRGCRRGHLPFNRAAAVTPRSRSRPGRPMLCAIPSIEPRQSRRGVPEIDCHAAEGPRPSIEPRQSRRGVEAHARRGSARRGPFNRAAAVTPRSRRISPGTACRSRSFNRAAAVTPRSRSRRGSHEHDHAAAFNRAAAVTPRSLAYTLLFWSGSAPLQ